MNTNKELFKACLEKESDVLSEFLSANIKMLSYKILASAVLQVYCFESGTTLATWNEKLRPGFVSDFDNMMNSAVNLVDFTHAHYMAFHDIKDESVADAIRHYVQQNRNILAQILNDPVTAPCFPSEVREQIKERFGDLSLTPKEKFIYKSKSRQVVGKNSFFEALIDEEKKFAANETRVGGKSP